MNHALYLAQQSYQFFGGLRKGRQAMHDKSKIS
jgi:hypothetical protein